MKEIWKDIVLIFLLSSCSVWQAAKSVPETAYSVGKIEGESLMIDKIEELNEKILSYQKKLQDCRLKKNCLKQDLFKREIKKLKSKIKKLKEKD